MKNTKQLKDKCKFLTKAKYAHNVTTAHTKAPLNLFATINKTTNRQKQNCNTATIT